MTIEGWSQTLGAGPLLLIAGGAIALLLFLILKLRLHAFVALILVSLLTAFATGIPTGSIVTVLTGSFGSTLATVALLVGLGAMLGRLVETSGGAKVLAETLIRVFGEKRAPFALGVASLIFGFPIFFDAGLVVMLPVIFSVARRLGGGVLRYGLPAAGAFSVMHIFVPPHPGPVTASGFFEANIGVVLILGLIIALPTWYLTSYLFGLWAGKKFVLPVPAVLGEIDEDDVKNPPRFGTVVAVLLLPLILIFLNTGLNTLSAAGIVSEQASEQTWYALLRTLGETPVALLISLLVASVVLGTRRGESKNAIEKVLESSLGPVCSVILITGAGGMFGGVLRTSGIGDALGGVLSDLGVPLILAGFLIAAILRIAQGSATVALTTAAALISPGVLDAGYNTVQIAAMVLAVAAGSVVVSHVNDSGFWLVGRFMGMDVKTTLKTWTVLETLIGVMGFALAALAFGLASLI
ncbi:GntP family permease [Arthrobacter gengyunqii]|uniref:GntP family permease n=1 Tax=Arthrobacter gengyunqii TaxID=2886940 RepID=A0A9X1M0W8_9MICC|nr:GntP family permease [Arthrobacter gengyunqii]MCC3268877.1 GntP family permease [Arthrobacter gengyunqii]UOY96258.1 GntP family permease [Arthrobacter gengyunqii]